MYLSQYIFFPEFRDSRETTGWFLVNNFFMYSRVFHLPRLSPILLFKIFKLCLTMKLTGMKKKLDSSNFELAQAN